MCKREKGIRFLIPGGQTKRKRKREPQMEKVIGWLFIKFRRDFGPEIQWRA